MQDTETIFSGGASVCGVRGKTFVLPPLLAQGTRLADYGVWGAPQ